MGTDPVVAIGLVASELRRPGVTYELVREKLRGPGVEVLRLGERGQSSFTGLKLTVDALRFRSSSVHCRWRMTDFVAHYDIHDQPSIMGNNVMVRTVI